LDTSLTATLTVKVSPEVTDGGVITDMLRFSAETSTEFMTEKAGDRTQATTKIIKQRIKRFFNKFPSLMKSG
jgi:hypothetical protein